MDVIIKNGCVVNGTGNPWFRADVGIASGRIVRLGKMRNEKAATVIDAHESVVCPGFIDMHSHADLMLFAEPENQAKLMQGVTTELLGQDGISVAPVRRGQSSELRKLLSGLLGDPVIDWSWQGVGEYLDKLAKHPIANNAAFLLPQGTLRVYVMGMEDRDPTQEELKEMKEIAVESMSAGAFGLSTGLIYPPCVYTKTWELTELCRTVAEHGGIFVSHIRDQGDRIFDSINEMIEIGKQAAIPIHISHLKIAGKRNWHRTPELMNLFDRARSDGVDITADQYPYTRGSTFLKVVLPSWVQEGSVNKLLERLRDPVLRVRIKKEIEDGIAGWENTVELAGGWNGITVSSITSEKNRRFEGKTVEEIAKILGKDPADTALDLILEEEGAVCAIIARTSEDSVSTIWKHQTVMMGTDSIFLGKPHPRTYGTCARILGKVVRQDGVMTIEEAIKKMTSLPAQTLGLTDRGIISVGAWADIVVFDPTTVIDVATYDDPRRQPKGIEYVLVNGAVVVEQGKHTGRLPGKVLRKGT